MDKEVIEVPVMSAKVRALGLPCSTAVRANGFVFISATPPVDMVTGEMGAATSKRRPKRR
ncbi:hypothetical protein LB528_23830 [Mesorhizobium sp. CA4]|nr:hypothetical protein [Mesorhizobium sp. CA4]